MQRLKCKEYGCSHNYCKHCVKDVIQVSNEAICRSFDPVNESNPNQARYEYEFACDIGLNTENDLHHILCNEEKCNYWNFGECNSHEIKVDKRNLSPKCVTFKPKN